MVWQIDLDNISKDDIEVDVFYGQDVAIANKNNVRNNEAYVCQYLDHKVFETKLVIRLYKAKSGQAHFLQQGSLSKTVAYSTDGFQFFGLDFKVTNLPSAMLKEQLENRNYQYEFAYAALQSEKISIKDKASFCFYGLFVEDMPEVVNEIKFIDEIKRNYQDIDIKQITDDKFSKLELKINFNDVLNSQNLTTEEIDELYPEKRHIEKENKEVLSFFYGDSSHVILKSKELLVERPHGHILITGDNLFIKENIISTTNYILVSLIPISLLVMRVLINLPRIYVIHLI